MKTTRNSAEIKKRVDNLANIPDEDINFADIPMRQQINNAITGLFQMSSNERAAAISRLKKGKIKNQTQPELRPAPERVIRYSANDMDDAIRYCAVKSENPKDAACGASFRISDYPPGYYPYIFQVQKNSDIDTCPICEIKSLKRLISNSDDPQVAIDAQADLDFLQQHHNDRMKTKPQ